MRGYAILKDDTIYIPVVAAEHEGAGDVGRFLDAVSPRCVFPSVFNPRLEGMLRRRGFMLDGDLWRLSLVGGTR